MPLPQAGSCPHTQEQSARPRGSPWPCRLVRRAGHRPGDARRLGAGPATSRASLLHAAQPRASLQPPDRAVHTGGQACDHSLPGGTRGAGAGRGHPALPPSPGEAAWGLEGRGGGTASLLTPVSSLLLRPPLRARPFSHSLR